MPVKYDQKSDDDQQVYDDKLQDIVHHYDDDASPGAVAQEDQNAAAARDAGATKQELSNGEESGGFYKDNDNKIADKSNLSESENQIAGGYNDEDPGSLPTRTGNFFWGSKRRKRSTIGGSIIGLLLGGGFGFFSIISGPLEFVHLAQLLEQFHFSRIDDFSNDRSTRVLLYALAGQGERSRLHFVGNKAADKFEKDLLDKHGVKPVFEKGKLGTRVFAGYEIVDESKASSIVEAANQDGIKPHPIGDEQSKLIGGRSSPVDGKHRIIDVRGEKVKVKRKLVRTITKATGINKIASALVSRVLGKRDGVNFHPLKNIVRDKKESLKKYMKERREERANAEREGTIDESLGENTKKDKDGNPVATEGEKGATKEANELIEEAGKETSKTAIKDLISKGIGPMAAVGLLCAVKGFGDNIPKYQYQNQVLPMLRMGMSAITVGNQIMSGQDFNMEELGALSQSFYQPEVKKDGKVVTQASDWSQARSIQAELGQPQTGPDLPPDEKLNHQGKKPIFFSIIDNIFGLGAACGVLKKVGNIPILKQGAEAASKVVMATLNAGLGIAGLSVNELMGDALAAAAGRATNVNAAGAEYGNLVNTGAFLASNDQFISMGGAQETPEQTAAINNMESSVQIDQHTSESFASRVFNPYSHYSLVGSLIDTIPHSVTGFMASIVSPLKNIGSTLSSLLPGVHAASNQPYNYGVPQYGFSLADRNNPKYENPYVNAQRVEPHLKELNKKYGKVCFGVEAVPSTNNDGVKLQNVGGINTFKLQEKHPECDPAKNNDPLFLPYRFYLADLANAKSMACYEVNNTEACSELGFGSGSVGDTSSGGVETNSAPSGSTADLAQQILNNPNITLNKQKGAKQDIEAAARGKKASPGKDGNGDSGAPGKKNCQPVFLNPNLLRIALTLAQKYKYEIRDIVSGHQCDTAQHPKGRAMDIFKIEGQSLDDSWWANSSNMAIVDDWAKLVGSVGKFQVGFGVGCSAHGKVKAPSNVFVFTDSGHFANWNTGCTGAPRGQDEIHIDVRGAP